MSSRRPAVLLALVLPLFTALLAQVACAGPGRSLPQSAAVRTVHPDVGAAEDGVACATCHEDVTPALVKEWTAGEHGLNLVKCFVCHGSTGADFAAAPAPQRCDGCHAAKVASVTQDGTSRSCFACHAPHTLSSEGKPNPHQS
jgi:hypothetical protein